MFNFKFNSVAMSRTRRTRKSAAGPQGRPIEYISPHNMTSLEDSDAMTVQVV